MKEEEESSEEEEEELTPEEQGQHSLLIDHIHTDWCHDYMMMCFFNSGTREVYPISTFIIMVVFFFVVNVFHSSSVYFYCPHTATLQSLCWH